MLYRELVQFDPIETIIQLREADDPQKAAELVRTYVISDRMAEILADVVVPQMQIDHPADNKGVFIVGNYGTGKSHLMSLLSALAEYPEALTAVSNPRVQQAAAAISGRFHVLRVEIGGVERSLRDSLLEELAFALEEWGTPYTFPPANQVTNNKDIIIEAVAGFREKYPDQGILLVVDELLDFLRSREERKLILDLGFLRELGEVAELTPFRFIGGVQETLFDNPRFSFVAEQLRRVRDRFEQVRIVREDIAYVVAQRLLRKNDEQLAWITEHLRQFVPLYDNMAERLAEFARLFPIHPAYIDTFERVTVVEKRQVLKTISQAMRALLDKPVPEDAPSLISYDHYWDRLRNNPSMRTLPGVAEVVEKSNVLEGRIKNAYTRKNLLPLALRIIHGLSVHRLTTDDIHVPLGATAVELRDDLALYMRQPEQSADFLLKTVQVALREIIGTVSGQYISYNEANGQYYLDVKKDIDFDAQIRQRSELMGDDELNRYFFDALRQVLNLSDTTYVTGHRIWFYELPWAEKKVNRPGYLFFGPPEERSTAQPPRDFYIYILPPFAQKAWQGQTQADEIVLRFTGLDQSFTELVRLYAGARALGNESATHRETYLEKATGRGGYLARLVKWLNENTTAHLRVEYEGVERLVPALLAQTRSSASRNLAELLQLLAAHLLAPQFDEAYPSYPAFTRLNQPVSENARAATAMEAVRALAGRGRTNLALAVLDGLGLLDNEDQIRPYSSPYAQAYLKLLNDKPEGQVVNRGELLTIVGSGIGGEIEKDILFNLEPEWVVVVLLALVYNGDIVLTLGGQKRLDAGSIEQAATMAIADLIDFRFYGRTTAVPVGLWAEIFEGLGLPAGLIRDENSREEAVRRLQSVVQAELNRVATIQGRIQQRILLWNCSLFTGRPLVIERDGTVSSAVEEEVKLPHDTFNPPLRQYKQMLETLSRFNTVGKLRNLRLSALQIRNGLAGREALERVNTLLHQVERLQPLTTYLAEAQANVADGDPWSQQAAAVQQRLLNELRRAAQGESAAHPGALLRELQTLKANYIAAYAQAHRHSVLGPNEDAQRREMMTGERWQALKALVTIDLLAANKLEMDGWAQAVTNLRVCTSFHEGLLEDSPTCTCRFRPREAGSRPAAERLDTLDKQLTALVLRWQQALRDSLNSETAQASMQALTAAEKAPLAQFLSQPDDDPAIPAGLVTAANQVLRGIKSLPVSADDLLDALKEGGMPCTVHDLQERFNRFIKKTMHGYDAANTRLTLE
ncbi:MAG: DUF6079 family protein [Candidatus Promineifilaceae bacterium]